MVTSMTAYAKPFHLKTEETKKESDDAWKEFVAKNNLAVPARSG